MEETPIFSSRIITEMNKMTNFRPILCSKWKLGRVKLLGTKFLGLHDCILIQINTDFISE